MAITNFIPTIWSENLYKALDRKYIGVANCNRDFDGEIKGMGSVVKICGVGYIEVSNYTKNTDMNKPQTLSDTVIELPIDMANYFNFQIDDIDRAQANPKLMEAAMDVAAKALAFRADRTVYDLFNQAGQTLETYFPEPEALVEVLLKAREKLFEQNVNDPSDIIIELSPAVATVLLKAKTALASDNTALLENGCIGNFYGCKVFVTNSIYSEHEDINIRHHCLVRTKRAIAFAEQLSEIEAYRPEKRFADAVKGLHLYGAKVIYPDEVLHLIVDLPYEGSNE